MSNDRESGERVMGGEGRGILTAFVEKGISKVNSEKELKDDFLDRGRGNAQLESLRGGYRTGQACSIKESKKPEKHAQELLETVV